MYFAKDIQELQNLNQTIIKEDAQIESQKNEIDTLANKLKWYDVEIATLEKSRMVEQQNIKVKEYNAVLADYNAKVQVYKNSLVQYNIKVEQVNSLKDKLDIHWYMLPLPVPWLEPEN